MNCKLLIFLMVCFLALSMVLANGAGPRNGPEDGHVRLIMDKIKEKVGDMLNKDGTGMETASMATFL